MSTEMDGYRALAAEIVKYACADYVDALILQEKGFVDYDDLVKRIFKEILQYGKRRYFWIDAKGRHVQEEKNNLKKLKHITELLDLESRKRLASSTIRLSEEFFRSGTFDIYMPNTNGEDLIKALQAKAKKGKRIIL